MRIKAGTTRRVVGAISLHWLRLFSPAFNRLIGIFSLYLRSYEDAGYERSDLRKVRIRFYSLACVRHDERADLTRPGSPWGPAALVLFFLLARCHRR